MQYNSMVIASRRKAGWDAFQAVGMAIEQQTAKKKIGTAYMECKLCWISLWLRNRGFEMDCPGENEGCTATLLQMEPLLEHRIEEKLGKSMWKTK